MGILDVLLSTDTAKLVQRETKELEVQRLSELLGEPFIISISPLSSSQIEHIGEVSKGDQDSKRNAIVESARLENKKFTEKDILEKFGALSGNEVVGKLFEPGEITAIYLKISDISGYSLEAVKEVKKK